MKLGENNLGGVAQTRGVRAGWDAATVVDDGDRVVDVDEHFHGVAMASQGLVDRVVDDLIDQVMKARLAGRSDIHRRTHPYRLKSLQDFDGVGAVGDLVRFLDHFLCRYFRFFGARARRRTPAGRGASSAGSPFVLSFRLRPVGREGFWDVSRATASSA